MRYQRSRNAEWIAWSWRYDSGLVVSGVPDAGAALALTPNQQVTIGLACKGVLATVDNPLGPDNCAAGPVTSKLITLPQGGYNGIPSAENDDHNPERVKPRNVFSLGVGTDNLLHAEGKRRTKASLSNFEPDQRDRTVQLPLHLQRDALPATQVIGGEGRNDV